VTACRLQEPPTRYYNNDVHLRGIAALITPLFLSMKNRELKLRALEDIWAFCDLIDFRGGSGTFYSLHREMAAFNCRNQTEPKTCREYRRRLFLVPREHRKSTVNTVLYILWRMYRNPNIRILIGTNVKDLATEFVTEIRAYLEDEELQDEVWNSRPHIAGRMVPVINRQAEYYKRRKTAYVEIDDSDEDDADYRKVIWSNWKLRLVRTLKAKEPTLTALSVGMRTTGKHYDLVILDDIVDQENSITPEKANKIMVWGNMLESVVTKKAELMQISPGFSEYVGNEIVINGTRYFHHDYYAKFVGNSEEERHDRLAKTRYSAFIRSVYKNGVDESDGWLCPEIYDDAVDQDMRDSMTDMMSVYYAQFHNKIVVPENAVIHSSMLRYYFSTHVEPAPHGTIRYYDPERVDPVSKAPQCFVVRLYMTVDLAGTTTRRSDRSAIAVGGLDELNRMIVPDLRAGKWRPSEIVQHVHELAKKWKLNAVYIETGGFQGTFLETMRDSFKKPGNQVLVLREYKPSSGLGKKAEIEAALSPLLENGMLIVAPHIKHTPLIEEMDTIGQIASAHDDCLDVLKMLKHVATPTPRANPDGSSVYRARHVVINQVTGGCR
jgi:predicted phage terminase large subunit-like protein